MIYHFSRQELKNKKASDFQDGDLIKCGKYGIYIKYKKENTEFDTPALLSFVENFDTCKILDCTPGIERPYYIDDFLNR